MIINEALNPKNIRYRIPDREEVPAQIERDSRFWRYKVDNVTLNKDFMGRSYSQFQSDP